MRTNAMYSLIRLQKQNLFQSYADVTTFIFVRVTVQANNMMSSHIFFFLFFFGGGGETIIVSTHIMHFAWLVWQTCEITSYQVIHAADNVLARQPNVLPPSFSSNILSSFFSFSIFFLQLFYFIFLCILHVSGLGWRCCLPSLPNQMRPYFFFHICV